MTPRDLKNTYTTGNICKHGTKTTPVFLPADGEASWSLLHFQNIKILIIEKYYIPIQFASPEECKLMRAFVQIYLSQFAVRSHGEWSCLQ